MALLFWISVAGAAYVYVGYPALLLLWARLRPRPVKCGEPEVGVSIVIAARNEASRLPARIDNLVSLDFPASRRQIIVVSDGSTDETLDVLARYRPVVEAVAVPPGGK